MQESEEVQDADVAGHTRSDLGLQMLDPRERQHVRLRIRADLVGHGLESRDHVVEGDSLLDTVLFAGEQPGRELGLLPRRVAPPDRAGHGRGVEDAVA